MVFKPGNEWNGNRNGAPKKHFRRDDFTEEMFADPTRKKRIEGIFDKLLSHAEDGQPWAVKLACEYGMTRPKNRDGAESDVRSKLVGTLIDMPDDKLTQIQSILLEHMNSQGEA